MLPFSPENLGLDRFVCSVLESTLAGMRAVVIDNGILRLSVLPEYGGRICSLFFRPLNLELLSTDFLHGEGQSVVVHGGWCSAFPTLLPEEEYLSHDPWEMQISHGEDEVTLHLSRHVERFLAVVDGQRTLLPGAVLAERTIRVTAGEPALDVEDCLTNRIADPLPVTWSGAISLRAQPGDRVLVPIERVEVQRGVGPSGNELDFGLLVTTPYQAFARDLDDGWIGFRPALAPVDIRLLFPKEHIPHAAIIALRDDARHTHGTYRIQPMVTCGPVADDAEDGALILPPNQPMRLPLRLEIGEGVISSSAWSREGVQLAESMIDQAVPPRHFAVWRVGMRAVVLKTPEQMVMLMPEFSEDSLLQPEDLPTVDLMLCGEELPAALLLRLAQRTPATFLGSSLKMRDELPPERAISFSPGARVDRGDVSVLATPARLKALPGRLGYLVQVDHLSVYHVGTTEYLAEFGRIGQEHRPHLVFLPLGGQMSMQDSVLAAKLLQPRVVVPLGSEEDEEAFAERCREQHVAFAVVRLVQGEGRLLDGWHIMPLE